MNDLSKSSTSNRRVNSEIESSCSLWWSKRLRKVLLHGPFMKASILSRILKGNISVHEIHNHGFRVPRKVIDAIKQIWWNPCHVGDGGSNLVQDLLNTIRKHLTLISIPLDLLNQGFRYWTFCTWRDENSPERSQMCKTLLTALLRGAHASEDSLSAVRVSQIIAVFVFDERSGGRRRRVNNRRPTMGLPSWMADRIHLRSTYSKWLTANGPLISLKQCCALSKF